MALGLVIFPSLVSCEFLEENPTTSLTKSSVYTTKEALEGSMIGIYASLSNGAGSVCGQQNEFLGSTSLLSHWNTKRSTENWTSCIKMTFFTTSSNGSTYFQKFYQIVNKCNTFLANLPGSPVEEEYKLKLEAEARFLRAVHYFYLARMYGDLSLVLTPPSDINATNVPRTKYTEVYKQILEDLDFAERNMRTKDEQITLSGYTGRAFNTAATVYKAAVWQQIASILSDPEYQFFDNSKPERQPDFTNCGLSSADPKEAEKEAWGKVIELTDQVIASGTYSLESDYAHLFRWSEPSDFTSPERIMVAQVTNESSADNLAAEYSLPPFIGNADGTGCTAESKNYSRYAPNRWVYQKWTELYGGQMDTGRSDGANVFVGCKDPRLDVSYIHNYYYSVEGGKAKKVSAYPSNSYVKSYSRNNSLYFKKYLSPRYNASNGDADYYMMRYAYVFLMRAEAFASLSETKEDANWTKAFETIDILHARARGELDPGAVQSAYPSWPKAIANGTLYLETPADLIMAIMWEYVFELHGEGFEFYLTHRRGARFLSEFIATPLTAFLKEPEQAKQFSTIFNSEYPETDPLLLKKSVLLSYPQSELERNPLAVQNDYIWK